MSRTCATLRARSTTTSSRSGSTCSKSIRRVWRASPRSCLDSKWELTGSPSICHPQARLQLDLHLSPHVDSLLSSIRQRALQSYFSPFASVSLDHMSAAFGWSADSTQAAVIDLIQRGALKARIDSAKGILVAKRVEPRVEAFRNALDQGEKMQKKAVASQLRCVRGPESDSSYLCFMCRGLSD